MKIIDASKLRIDEDSCHKDVLPTTSGNFVLGIGTKEGRVLVWRASSTTSGKLFSSKKGLGFGSVSAIDISEGGPSTHGADLIAATSYGETFHYKLLDKINE